MDDNLRTLKAYLNSLINVDDHAFDQFSGYTQLKHVRKGELLLHGGNRCDNLYFIVQGLFRTYHLKNDNEVNTCFCGENEVTCSFESFTTNKVSKDFIEALEDSVVLSLSNRDLAELVSKDPIWDELRRILTDQECIRLSNRIDTLSFSTAQEKYESLLKNQKKLVQRIPIQHLASYLGISRETLSRVRSKVAQN